MTAREYIDDIKLRLLRYGVDADLNSELILTFINKARRSVQRILLPLYPERFATIFTVTHSAGNINNNLSLTSNTAMSYVNSDVYTYALPSWFIDSYEVIVRWNSILHGGVWTSRARRFSQQEMNTVLSNTWNAAVMEDPMYSSEFVGNQPFLNISGLTPIQADASGNVSIDIYSIVALSSLEDVNTGGVSDTETVIPSFAEEIVIYEAMLLCLEVLNQPVAYQMVEQEKSFVESSIVMNYGTKRQREEVLLPSKEEKEGV